MQLCSLACKYKSMRVLLNYWMFTWIFYDSCRRSWIAPQRFVTRAWQFELEFLANRPWKRVSMAATLSNHLTQVKSVFTPSNRWTDFISQAPQALLRIFGKINYKNIACRIPFGFILAYLKRKGSFISSRFIQMLV